MSLTQARGIGLITALAAIAVVAGFLVGYPTEVVAVTTIAVAALVAVETTRELAARAGLRAHPATAPDRPPLEQLRQVGRALGAAQSSAFAADRELRPLFREIAAMRLARRGVDLDRQPQEASAVLGDQLWELVRADRERGSNLVAGGISAVGLESMIERLERI